MSTDLILVFNQDADTLRALARDMWADQDLDSLNSRFDRINNQVSVLISGQNAVLYPAMMTVLRTSTDLGEGERLARESIRRLRSVVDQLDVLERLTVQDLAFRTLMDTTFTDYFEDLETNHESLIRMQPLLNPRILQELGGLWIQARDLAPVLVHEELWSAMQQLHELEQQASTATTTTAAAAAAAAESQDQDRAPGHGPSQAQTPASAPVAQAQGQASEQAQQPPVRATPALATTATARPRYGHLHKLSSTFARRLHGVLDRAEQGLNRIAGEIESQAKKHKKEQEQRQKKEQGESSTTTDTTPTASASASATGADTATATAATTTTTEAKEQKLQGEVCARTQASVEEHQPQPEPHGHDQEKEVLDDDVSTKAVKSVPFDSHKTGSGGGGGDDHDVEMTLAKEADQAEEQAEKENQPLMQHQQQDSGGHHAHHEHTQTVA